VTISGVLGTAVTVAANSNTRINFGTLSLTVEATSTTEVSVTSLASVSAAMPAGHTAIGFDAQAGFQISYSTDAVARAELTTPPLSASAAAQIDGSVKVACLRYDADLDFYGQVDVQSYNSASKEVTVDVLKAGGYYFAAVDINAAIPTFYSEARTTSSTSATLEYPEGFSLVVATASNNKVTVVHSTMSQRTDPEGQRNVGAFYSVDLQQEQSVTATLKYQYDAAMSAEAAQTLRFAFYSDGEWKFPDSGVSVDTEARVVSQTTTHFSEWGVFENSNNEDRWAKTNQPLNPTTPSRCYAVDYDHTLGVINFKMTKVEGPGTLRMYLLKGDSCPHDGDHQMRSMAVADAGGSDTLCVTSDTTPDASDGRYMVSVYAEGLSSGAGQTKFDLEITNDLFCSAASVTQVLSLAAMAVLAMVAAALA